VGRVGYEHVSLRYPGASHDTLSEINLAIEPGEFVALVGPTGSGKSSLLNLLPRFYNPTAGRVTIDGVDISAIEAVVLRDRIGIVPQTTWLSRGSIRANIAFGRPDASTADIERAASWASAAGFIQTLPMGYDTQLGEAGSGLSGGQQQRIALARALIRRPPILILDDATSALDAATERDVLDALRQLPFSSTRLFATARLAVMEAADRVVLVVDGRIEATGRHVELVRANPTYAAIFEELPNPEVAQA